MITEERAREIACNWHGGQVTALYAFCSSGTILSYLLPEINECLRTVYPYSDEYRQELQSLKVYVESKIGRRDDD